MYDYSPQANQLADQGRYGDSMMVHMNPLEVALMNQMSGNKMTINPTTGQPEAFAFLLPILASMGGTALGGAAGLGALGVGAAGAAGAALGQTAATGSLKEGLKTGLLSAATAGLGSLLAPAAGAATAGTTGFASKLGSAVDVGKVSEVGKAYKLAQAAKLGAVANTGSLGPGFDNVLPAVNPTTGLDLLKASAIPGAFSGAVGASQYQAPFKDDNPDFLGKRSDIPEAAPPTRRLNPMAMTPGGMGERQYFTDDALTQQSGVRPQPGGSQSFSDIASKYGGVSRMEEGGLASLDPAAMQAPIPESMQDAMQDSMQPPMPEDQAMMQSEGGREDTARVFNEAVAALMGQHPAPKEAVRRFLEVFGEERLMALVGQIREKMESPQEGRMVTGDGPDGVDNIPASVEGQQPVLLANNEYILPEKVTSAVGNGDPNAGAEALNEMVAQV
jgi:hypothetical protein